jgi:hypothetical protein
MLQLTNAAEDYLDNINELYGEDSAEYANAAFFVATALHDAQVRELTMAQVERQTAALEAIVAALSGEAVADA